jgi:dipeptidyl-peptidase-4
MKLSIFLFLLSFYFTLNVNAQDTISKDAYTRAISYMRHNLGNKQIFNVSIEPHWLPNNEGLWFETQSFGSKEFKKISFPKNKISPLFDHKKLATALAQYLGEPVSAEQLPFTWFDYVSPSEIQFDIDEKRFAFDGKKGQIIERPVPAESLPVTEIASPDSSWIAYVEDYNLFIRSPKTNEIKQLSTTGKKGYEYASRYGWGDIMEGESSDRPYHFNVEWSSDSKWISATICDLRSAQKMYLLDHTIDSIYRPKLLSYYRGSPGDTAMVYENPVFFNVETGKEIKPKLARSTHIDPIEVYPSEMPAMVYLIKLDRGYQKLTVYVFDLNTEELTQIYSESSETNIDNFDNEVSEKTGKAFILSEKSGWRQIHSLDFETLEEHALTNGTYYIHDIIHLDEENELLYFTAAGKEEGINPYWTNLYVIPFKGGTVKLLTDPSLHHEISMSPDGTRFVDNASTVQIPTTTTLRTSSDGSILTSLGKADISQLTDWHAPEPFTALAGDGETIIYGAFWKPTDFDDTKSYPIIDASYTGPHTSVYPRDFYDAFQLQSLAELGFIVVSIDGRGSAFRSKIFHDFSYRNLAGGLEDHVEAIRQLGEKYSWVDTDKVGIYGHSAGGYDAGHALLAYPDFYKVAVASSGDHDHRMEKAWWPEMYMGWPVGKQYDEQSNITMAGNLKGKLLIAHGGIDENVNPSATFRLAEALIKNDKQFDLLILPSQHHGYRNIYWDYFTKTRWNYFIEHLQGLTPIWDIDWK